MIERFVDTSGWGSWADSHQLFHSAALACVNEVWQHGGRLVTSNWVLVELTSLLTRPLRVAKAQQVQLLADIRGDPGVLIVAMDSGLEASAWRLWETRLDKEWSLTDCASFV